MKKSIAALVILLALAAGAWGNLRYLEHFLGELESQVRASQEAEDRSEAIALLRESLDQWNAAAGYTHVVLRHSDVDNTTDAYYGLLQQLSDEELDPGPSYEHLLDQLRRVLEMEQVSLGSIL